MLPLYWLRLEYLDLQDRMTETMFDLILLILQKQIFEKAELWILAKASMMIQGTASIMIQFQQL